MGVRTLIIWDWDGTLVDSQATVLAALQDVATEFNQSPITQADVSNVMNNHRSSFWSNHFGVDFDAQFNYFLSRFEHHNATKELQMFEGSVEAIRWLKSHNIPQMVISNKPQYLLDEECDRLELHSYFMRVIGTEPGNENKKPDASFGYEALQDLLYDQLIMIGDGEADMNFARNINAVAIYVENPPLPNIPYDYLIPHAELLTFMQDYFYKG